MCLEKTATIKAALTGGVVGLASVGLLFTNLPEWKYFLAGLPVFLAARIIDNPYGVLLVPIPYFILLGVVIQMLRTSNQGRAKILLLVTGIGIFLGLHLWAQQQVAQNAHKAAEAILEGWGKSNEIDATEHAANPARPPLRQRPGTSLGQEARRLPIARAWRRAAGTSTS